MAIHLSQQIVMQQQIIIASRRTSSSVRQSDAITAWPKKKAISGGVDSTQSKKRWAYIHVGKTGGTTLKFVLKSNCNIMGKAKNQRLCRKKLEDLLGPESNLSMATILSIHANKGWMGQYRKLNNALTGFLISVRNPLTRYQSSFYMSHPANPSSGLSHRWRNSNSNSNSNNSSSVYFYQTCFQSMEDIATLLQLVAKAGEHSHSVSSKMPVTLTPQQQECYSLAIDNLIGNKVGLKCGHCGMNYQYYHRRVITKCPSCDIWVVRTEKLWDDISHIDKLLGGHTNFSIVSNTRITHKSERHNANTALSDSGTHTLCCFLAGEIQLYQDYLYKAVNLELYDKQETLQVVFNMCGVDYNGNHGSNFSWIRWAESSSQCLPFGINATMLLPNRRYVDDEE
jgi:hypothetical protein